jgi:hypothetical protein
VVSLPIQARATVNPEDLTNGANILSVTMYVYKYVICVYVWCTATETALPQTDLVAEGSVGTVATPRVPV